MKRNIKFLSIILTLVLSISLIIGLTACGDNPTTTNTQDTLIVGSTTKIKSLDRRQSGSSKSAGYSYDILSASLTQLTPIISVDGEYQPMACNFTISDDQKTVTFKVVDGLTWHDGTPVTNDDVMFTLSNKFNEGTEYAKIEQTEDSIKITLSGPVTRLFDKIILERLQPKHIFSREDLATLKDEETIVGCGPFKFNKYDKNKNILVFDKYASYPQADKVAFDKVIVKLYNDASVMDLALKRGEIDMMYTYQKGLTPSELEDFSKTEGITVSSYPTNAMNVNLFFNNEKVTKNERLAVRKAIDYDAFRNTFGSAEAIKSAAGFVPKSAFGAKDTEVLTRDLEGAKALLRAEGYSEAHKFEFELLVRSDLMDSQYAELIKGDLEETGLINVTVLSKEVEAWQTIVRAGNHMACFGKVTNGGFDMEAGYAGKYMLPYESSVMKGKNMVPFANVKIDEGETRTAFGDIYYNLMTAPTNAALEAAVQAYQDYISENAPAISLVVDKTAQAYSNKLTGFTLIKGFEMFNVKTFETLRRA